MLVGRIGLVVLCFREVDIGIGKLNEKFDDVFLTEGLWGKGISRRCMYVFDFLKVEIDRCWNHMWILFRIKLGDGRYCIMIMIRRTMYYMLVWLRCGMIELGSIYGSINTGRYDRSISISA